VEIKIMTAPREVHVGEVGIDLRLTLLDQDGEVFDISGATGRTLILEAPSGATRIVSAALLTDGTDGGLRYATQSGDIDEAGRWSLQGKVEWASGRILYSKAQTFLALEPLA
jgi:hypothetical protein